MIYLYTSDIKKVKSGNNLSNLLNQLPVSKHKRAYRYKFDKDSFNYVMGRLLLKRGLSELNINTNLENIAYHRSGKPYLKNVFFNISHTEDLVVCAISLDGEVGVDVERIKRLKMSDFEAWFTKSEWMDIKKSPSRLKKFYWYWTRKESIIKALGVNLSYLHQIEVNAANDYFEENRKRWYLQDLELGDGYIGALCSAYAIEKVKLTDCSFI